MTLQPSLEMPAAQDMQTAEDRVRELVGALRPVRPIPPLRMGLGAAAATWLGVVGVLWLVGKLAPRPWNHSDWSDPAFLVVLLGLALIATGSTSAALASAVPGRERASRVGLGIGVLGILLAVTSERLWISPSDLLLSRADLLACLGCLSHATGLGILSALMTCAFVGFGFLRRPSSSAALALVGGVALGAIVVHASCEATNPVHQLFSHALSPGVAAASLTLPTALALRLLAGRVRHAAPTSGRPFPRSN